MNLQICPTTNCNTPIYIAFYDYYFIWETYPNVIFRIETICSVLTITEDRIILRLCFVYDLCCLLM